MIVPVRPLGRGAFGSVYLAYKREMEFFAAKLIQKKKFEQKELDAAVELGRDFSQCPFILKYYSRAIGTTCIIFPMEYSNFKTLDIIAKKPHITLPSYTLRALMKQTFEGMRLFHSSGLVHRRQYTVKQSTQIWTCSCEDLGFAKKEDSTNMQTYAAGTLPYMGPELFQFPSISTQKVDIFALAIVFYHIITHKYPVYSPSFEEQQMKMNRLKCINRPQEIKNNILWDLLSKMLEFDPDKRISALQALQHPYFTSPEALADISKEQQDLAQQAQYSQHLGDLSITEYDKQSTFVVAESVMKIFLQDNILFKTSQQQQNQSSQSVQISTQLNPQTIFRSEVRPEIEQYPQSQNPSHQQQSIKQHFQQDQKQISVKLPQQMQTVTYTTPQTIIKSYIHPESKINQQSYEQELKQQPHRSPLSIILSQVIPESMTKSQTSIYKQTIYQQSIFSIHDHSTPEERKKQQQLALPSKIQQQAEQDLIEMKLSLEQINIRLNSYQQMSLLELDVLCAILLKQLESVEINKLQKQSSSPKSQRSHLQNQQFNKQNCNQVLQLGIIDKLMNILIEYPVNQIYPHYYYPIYFLVLKEIIIDNQDSHHLVEKIHILYDKLHNCDILATIFRAQHSIQLLSREGLMTRGQKEREFFMNLFNGGGLALTVHIQQVNGKKFCDSNSEGAIGFMLLFMKHSLPEYFKDVIIKHLLEILTYNDDHLSQNALAFLSVIAEQEENYEQLIAGGIIEKTIKLILNSIYEERGVVDAAQSLLNELFESGRNQQRMELIVELAKQGILSNMDDINERFIVIIDKLVVWLELGLMSEEKRVKFHDNQRIFKDIKDKILRKQDSQLEQFNYKEAFAQIQAIFHETQQGTIKFNELMLIKGGCNTVKLLLKSNIAAIPVALEGGGIIDEVISVIMKLQIEEVREIHLVPFEALIEAVGNDCIESLKGKGILTILRKVLDSKLQTVLVQAIEIIFRIISSQTPNEKDQRQTHTLLSTFEQNGISAKLIEILNIDNFEYKRINSLTALSLGFLFISSHQYNELKSNIINHLIEILTFKNNYLSIKSLEQLNSIAEQQENHEQLIKGGILEKLIKLIKNTDDDERRIIHSAKLMFCKMIEFGNRQTRIQIQFELEKQQIMTKTSNVNDKFIDIVDRLFGYIEMQSIQEEDRKIFQRDINILNEIDNRIKQSNKEGIKKIVIEEKVLLKLLKIIHDVLQGQIKSYQIILTIRACNAVNQILDENDDVYPTALEERGIIDEIISMIQKIPSEYLRRNHLIPLRTIIENSEDDLCIALIGKGILKALRIGIENLHEDIILESLLIISYVVRVQMPEYRKFDIHPMYKQFEKDGMLAKLIEILNNDSYEDQRINSFAALTIGLLFKNTPIPNEIGLTIINHLQNLIQGKSLFLHNGSLNAICDLALNPDNHQLILANNYLKQLNNMLNQQSSVKTLIMNFLLIVLLIGLGSDQTHAQLLKDISIDLVKQFTQHQNEKIKEISQQILKMWDQMQNQVQSRSKKEPRNLIGSQQEKLQQNDKKPSNDKEKVNSNNLENEKEQNVKQMKQFAQETSKYVNTQINNEKIENKKNKDKEKQNVDIDDSPIECDQCHRVIPFFQYSQHCDNHLIERQQNRKSKPQQSVNRQNTGLIVNEKQSIMKKENDKQEDIDDSLIECDRCNQKIPFYLYGQHYDRHLNVMQQQRNSLSSLSSTLGSTSNSCSSQLQQATKKQMIQTKENTNEKEKNNEKVKEKEIQQEKESQNNDDESLIKCDRCHKQIPFNQYEQHYKSHLVRRTQQRNTQSSLLQQTTNKQNILTKDCGKDKDKQDKQ